MSTPFFDLFKQFRGNELKLLTLVQEFIATGALLDQTDDEGELLLHHACAQKHGQLALLLMNATSDCDKKSKLGITPLHYAAANSLLEVCQKLIQKGVDPNAKTTDGLTPLFLALEYGSEETAAYLATLSTDLLTPVGDYGRTFLHMAAIKGNEKLCEAILNQGIPADLYDIRGYTPLQLAVRENHPKVIELLVGRGASLSYVNPEGLAASSIASSNYRMLRLLQKLGDPYITEDQFPDQITLPLPVFRYHPDPLTSGSMLKNEDDVCNCCNKLAGYYCYYPGDESICPWCIASGKAYRKYEIPCTEIDFSAKNIPSAIRKEVEQRTPGFAGWQQECWLTCCNDACAYLGTGGLAELSKFGTDAIATIKKDVMEEYKVTDEEADYYLSELSFSRSPSAYLFQCLTCKKFKSYSDAD